MRSLSDYKDEEALDMLADLIDPIANIFGDEKVAEYYRAGVTLKAVQVAIKNHKEDVMNLLALLEGVPVGEYHCNLFTLPKVLLNVFNDPELKDFFILPEQKDSETPFGSVTETTGEDTDTSSNI